MCLGGLGYRYILISDLQTLQSQTDTNYKAHQLGYGLGLGLHTHKHTEPKFTKQELYVLIPIFPYFFLFPYFWLETRSNKR